MKYGSEAKTKANTSQIRVNETKAYSPKQQANEQYPSNVIFSCASLAPDNKVDSQSNEYPKKIRSKSQKREKSEESYQLEILNKIKQNENLSPEIKLLAMNLLCNGPAVKFEDMQKKKEIDDIEKLVEIDSIELKYGPPESGDNFQSNFFGNISNPPMLRVPMVPNIPKLPMFAGISKPPMFPAGIPKPPMFGIPQPPIQNKNNVFMMNNKKNPNGFAVPTILDRILQKAQGEKNSQI